MSTFEGRMEELPGVSVDRFDGANLDSSAFFLSHCHTDHMVGLSDPKFHQKLLTNNLFLYLSHISAQILKVSLPSIADNLIELDMHTPTTLTIATNHISVTPIPAGHCPGSVMFLFEADKTVLYTGDFRINPEDIPKFTAFYNSMNMRKRVDAVYLDTTFFLKAYSRFPPRDESLDEICAIIKNWLVRSDKHVIGLNTCAKYGYEYLFIEIHKRLKMQIHVNGETYGFCRRVPELDQAVTRFKDQTRIHSACGSHYTVICMNTIAYKVKTVKVSAFRWKSDCLQNGISETLRDTHFVCYSTHASYEEGAQLLKFLKPKKVMANVLHNKPAVDAEIFKNIEEILEVREPKAKKVKLFQVVEETEVREEDVCVIPDSPPGKCEIDVEESSILDSPPRKFKVPEENSCILDSPPRKYAS